MPTLTSGLSDSRSGRAVGALATMVVRMHIEHDKGTTGPPQKIIEPRGERCRPKSSSTASDASTSAVGEAVGPHIKAPGILRAEVHRRVTPYVRSTSEPGTPHEHPAPASPSTAIRERVFLASACLVIDGHPRGDGWPQVMTRMHHGRDELAFAVAHVERSSHQPQLPEPTPKKTVRAFCLAVVGNPPQVPGVDSVRMWWVTPSHRVLRGAHHFDGGFLDEFLDDALLDWFLLSSPRLFVLPDLDAGRLPRRPMARNGAHSDSAATYVTDEIQPVTRDTGIITTQKTVSHPFTRRMNMGSPWIDAHNDRMTSI